MMLRVPVVTTIVIAVALAAYSLLGIAGAQRKLAAIEPIAPRGDYRITLDFAPERFHQVLLQEQGRLVEVRAATVYLKDVAPVGLRSIASHYWVLSIERWNGQ
jgi:hypothetical protein